MRRKGVLQICIKILVIRRNSRSFKIVSDHFSNREVAVEEEWIKAGLVGVFIDIKDEYKVRVNKSYEIAQILKSGDCYDTPYFNKVVEVVNEEGKVVGHTYIELINDGHNVKLDKMPYQLVVKK